MKLRKLFFPSLICMAAAAGLASCDDDDIVVTGANTDSIQTGNGNVVYITDALNQTEGDAFTIVNSGSFNLYAQSSQAITGECKVTFTYSPDALAGYNATAGTNYTAVPASMVTLANGGVVSIASGQLKSTPLEVSINSNGDLNPSQVYALPLTFTVENGSAAEGNNTMVVLVKDVAAYPGADKTYNGQPGMKVMAVMEVNDQNPLNVIPFTLKESGKQLFDICVLFSANINYNATTGEVYISRNNNIQALLDNRDKYLKPIQERGIKVVMGILGNWDASGISTLTPETSARFAQSVKTFCDSYNLDGVFLDDEYTDYDAAASGHIPGFQARSVEAASRMAYDIKQAMPDKLLISYRYEDLYSAVAINGQEPGKFFDYVVNDYWVTSDPTTTYPGLKQSQAGTGSWNCSDWSQCIPSSSAWTKRFSLEGMRQDGYGIMMVYNLNVNPGYWMTPYIVRDLGKTAQAFYDAELQYTGEFYSKDW